MIKAIIEIFSKVRCSDTKENFKISTDVDLEVQLQVDSPIGTGSVYVLGVDKNGKKLNDPTVDEEFNLLGRNAYVGNVKFKNLNEDQEIFFQIYAEDPEPVSVPALVPEKPKSKAEDPDPYEGLIFKPEIIASSLPGDLIPSKKPAKFVIVKECPE